MKKPIVSWHKPTLFPLLQGYKRVRITLEYDGSKFHGFQLQDGNKTVQGELENALEKLYNKKIRVFASGRTDKGVHAKNQVCHFDIDNDSIKRVDLAINFHLSNNIRIKDFTYVDENFHSRFSSLAREYTFRIKDQDNFSIFDKDKVSKVRKLPDINLLNEYSKIILGAHDFSSFCSKEDKSKTRVRDIYKAIWIKKEIDFKEFEYNFIIRANAFLWNMIRIIAGTMIEMANKNLDPNEFKEILNYKNREKAGSTLSGDGLYLTRIYYEDDFDS